MSDRVLNLDYPNQQFTSADGGSAEGLVFVQGDTPAFRLNIFDQRSGDSRPVKGVFIRTIVATLGKTLAPPVTGKFRLKVDATLKAAILFDADAATVLSTLGAVEVLKPIGCCWLARFATDVTLTQATEGTTDANTLLPISFVRLRETEINGVQWWEVRLIQTPIAIASTFDTELAAGPEVVAMRDGNAGGPGVAAVNEIQRIHVPAEFVGTYDIRFSLRTSNLIGNQDGPDEIAAKLNAMWTDGVTRFKVTNVEDEYADVEFVGPFEKADQDLMVRTVRTFEPGKPVIILDCGKEPFCAMLRAVEKVEEVPFEIELNVVDDPDDLDDLAVKGRFLSFQMLVTIVREQKYAELTDVPTINWLKPPLPKSYVPFDPGMVITGSQHYAAAFGDGVATEFDFAHSLAQATAIHAIRFNATPGRVLQNGGEYELRLEPNSATVETTFVATTNELIFMLSTYGPLSAFAAHLHEIEHVNDLRAELDAIEAAVATLEDRLPFTDPSVLVTTGSGGSLEITIPTLKALYPGKFDASYDPKSGKDPKKVFALYPAVLTASSTNAATLPGSPASGTLYKNNSGAAYLVPGGFGHRSADVENNGFFSYEGRGFYILNRLGSGNSYYPRDMERTLFAFGVNAGMLTAGKTLRISFELLIGLVAATTGAQYDMVIEFGTVPADSSPSPVGDNLLNIVWDVDNPILKKRLVMTNMQMKHTFGAAVFRSLANAFTADQRVYDAWVASANHPASADFAIRARLIQFDTENSAASAKGAVCFEFTPLEAIIS